MGGMLWAGLASWGEWATSERWLLTVKDVLRRFAVVGPYSFDVVGDRDIVAHSEEVVAAILLDGQIGRAHV